MATLATNKRIVEEYRMMPKQRLICTFLLICLVLMIYGCNRSALRIPGASLSFPETPTGFTAKTIPYPYVLVVSLPVDKRSEHYGEHIAGTKWTGCSTDPFWGANAPEVIEQRLLKELQASGLFSKVTTTQASPDDVVMKTDIYAFCSQTVGFIIGRVAGIASLHVTFEQNGKVLTDQKFEKVVTDADKEYTGSQVGMIEQAMTVTMADSLRELSKDMLRKIDTEAATWKKQ
jgi:hypothetical protein